MIFGLDDTLDDISRAAIGYLEGRNILRIHVHKELLMKLGASFLVGRRVYAVSFKGTPLVAKGGTVARSSQILSQSLIERVSHLALGRLRPVFDLRQQ